MATLILLLESVKFSVLYCAPQYYSISTQFALVTILIFFHHLISYMTQIVSYHIHIPCREDVREAVIYVLADFVR